MLEKLKYFDDPNFRYDHASHSYVYVSSSTGKPIQIFEPVSGFISQFKIPFDSERISKYVAKKQGRTQQEVLDEWKATAKEGTDLGSSMHEWIEEFYKGSDPGMPSDNEKLMQRITSFKKLYESRLHKIIPVKQEFKVFSRKWGIAGTLDGLFGMNSLFYVGDWKSNKKFTDDTTSDGKRQKLLPPFDDLWDNSLSGYSLQVSTYRLILEEEAGFETAGGFLVWIGPKEAKMYKAYDLRDRLRSYLNENNYTL